MQIIRLKELLSTNGYASEQLREANPSDFTVYLAESQLQGKGQKGNSWESESGKNLTFSIILRPYFLPIPQQYLLSKVVCLGIVQMLSTYIEGVHIKWPNDIYVHDKKICGILIENQIRGMELASSIVGVGLNVNQEMFLSDAPNPISMKQLTQTTYKLNEVLQELLLSVQAYYEKLKDSKNISTINAEFLKHLYRIGEWHCFTCGNELFEGRIDGVNEIGQLQLTHKNDGQQRVYNFKEVAYML